MNQDISRADKICRAVVRKLRLYVGAATAVTLVAVTWALIAALPGSVGLGAQDSDIRATLDTASAPVASGAAWGGEALNAIHEHVAAWSPISDANACGMGASSCFKCHNGKRAAAPKMDKKANPWHPDHNTVNDSCVGCHGGNARIIKQDIAHTNLVKDPRVNVETCATCHKSGNAPTLLKSYQISATGRK